MKIKFIQRIRDDKTRELYLTRIRLLPMVVIGKKVYFPPLNAFIHIFHRSDHDRALHDHPWPSLSFKLWGACVEHYWSEKAYDFGHHYDEWFPGVLTRNIPWLRPIYRPATWRHRIELVGDGPVVTLFLVGFKQRTWGFWPNGYFVRHTEYLEHSTYVD